MVLPLLGYFLCMITVLAAAAGAMIGLFNTSTSDRPHYYPRPVVERNITTATNREPRLFNVVPETKGGTPAKDMETDSTVVPTEKTDAKKKQPSQAQNGRPSAQQLRRPRLWECTGLCPRNSVWATASIFQLVTRSFPPPQLTKEALKEIYGIYICSALH
jgi:hypothetical protein